MVELLEGYRGCLSTRFAIVRWPAMTIPIIVRTVRGLEWIAAEEIARRVPDSQDLEMNAREVVFNLGRLDERLLRLQTVDDVFVEVASLEGAGTKKSDLSSLATNITRVDWRTPLGQLSEVRTIPRRPRFDVVASVEGRRPYNRFDVESIIGNALEPVIQGTHLPRTREHVSPIDPHFTIRLFLRGIQAKAAIRLGQRPLHRRAYKQDTGSGTLHPPVAAMLARLADPKAGETIADPFCGDGTIAIETALFGAGTRVIASDRDLTRLQNTRRNAKRVGVQLALAVSDAGRLPWPPRTINAVITNPPWNVSVSTSGHLSGSLNQFWHHVPTALAAGGRICLIVDANLRTSTYLCKLGYQLVLAAKIRLAGRVSEVIFTSPPECDLPKISTELVGWRKRALSEGVITETGW